MSLNLHFADARVMSASPAHGLFPVASARAVRRMSSAPVTRAAATATIGNLEDAQYRPTSARTPTSSSMAPRLIKTSRSPSPVGSLDCCESSQNYLVGSRSSRCSRSVGPLNRGTSADLRPRLGGPRVIRASPSDHGTTYTPRSFMSAIEETDTALRDGAPKEFGVPVRLVEAESIAEARPPVKILSHSSAQAKQESSAVLKHSSPVSVVRIITPTPRAPSPMPSSPISAVSGRATISSPGSAVVKTQASMPATQIVNRTRCHSPVKTQVVLHAQAPPPLPAPPPPPAQAQLQGFMAPNLQLPSFGSNAVMVPEMLPPVLPEILQPLPPEFLQPPPAMLPQAAPEILQPVAPHAMQPQIWQPLPPQRSQPMPPRNLQPAPPERISPRGTGLQMYGVPELPPQAFPPPVRAVTSSLEVPSPRSASSPGWDYEQQDAEPVRHQGSKQPLPGWGIEHQELEPGRNIPSYHPLPGWAEDYQEQEPVYRHPPQQAKIDIPPDLRPGPRESFPDLRPGARETFPNIPPEGEVYPEVLRVVGRDNSRENASLNGEYRITQMHEGKPIYQKLGTTVVIRYWPREQRWLIDKDGNRQSDVCNAFAEQRRARHPAVDDLIWHVWESAHSRHMVDPSFFVTTNPETIQCRGRRAGKENDRINGEYTLVGLHQGKVAYQKLGTQHVIRYWPQDDRWLIDFEGLRDCGVCNAFCDADGTSHPGHGTLHWNIWETTRGKHIPDPDVRTFTAPGSCEMIGQEIISDNVTINGTYELMGLHDGKPWYQQGVNGHCIKFNFEKHQWQLDPEDFGGVCKAFAEVADTEHPGSKDLVWHVWAIACRRYITDAAMKSFTAPRFVEIKGRAKGKSNRSINGLYHVCGFHKGLPAYRKVGKVPSNHTIRYWPPADQWIIDAEGIRDIGLANAWAHANCADHPGYPSLIWHVWEQSWGQHLADEDIVASRWTPPEKAVLNGE
eukprot:gnl/MRDRNA2_/MRDRNA2_34637_c0_seq1.p1 gnl/MRDRNA2_/MRDRNA2_34637_c0~~gnl/MRDRNA2_/MRDRNA2_34637_c0_seq1.p1  ORF type:complete len:959 (+),score=117.30 gnl/MRDRNA2_/MRDRNA2_34637_c0_seq1:112-2988(+)